MNEIEKHICQCLGIKVFIAPLRKPLLGQLPMYLTYTYEVQETTIHGQQICLLIGKGKDTLKPNQLHKQMHFVMSRLELPVVYVFKDVASYNLRLMKEKRINFIILSKKIVHLPDLAMIFGKVAKNPTFQSNFLTPLAQFLLLYHLQKKVLNGFTIQQLSDKFDQSYLMTNRAVKNLEKFELCHFFGGKNKQVQFVARGKELWEKAQDFLQNPIERNLFTDETPDEKQVCFSNINALSHYSMLNDEKHRTYAIGKNELKNLTIETDKYNGEHTVEVWRYNPKPLSIDGFVDKLSIYLLFKNDDDPRIQIELERRIINEMKWLEE